MFHVKESDFALNTKQICKMLVRTDAVEEEVADLQEVRGSNPCKEGTL